jgi:hypothetical protein
MSSDGWLVAKTLGAGFRSGGDVNITSMIEKKLLNQKEIAKFERMVQLGEDRDTIIYSHSRKHANKKWRLNTEIILTRKERKEKKHCPMCIMMKRGEGQTLVINDVSGVLFPHFKPYRTNYGYRYVWWCGSHKLVNIQIPRVIQINKEEYIPVRHIEPLFGCYHLQLIPKNYFEVYALDCLMRALTKLQVHIPNNSVEFMKILDIPFPINRMCEDFPNLFRLLIGFACCFYDLRVPEGSLTSLRIEEIGETHYLNSFVREGIRSNKLYISDRVMCMLKLTFKNDLKEIMQYIELNEFKHRNLNIDDKMSLFELFGNKTEYTKAITTEDFLLWYSKEDDQNLENDEDIGLPKADIIDPVKKDESKPKIARKWYEDINDKSADDMKEASYSQIECDVREALKFFKEEELIRLNELKSENIFKDDLDTA